MTRLMRRFAVVIIPSVVAAGALLGTGSPAIAATAQLAAHPSARIPAIVNEQMAAHRHIDPWIADQLALFDPAAARRIAVYDPWVKDQLARFADQAR